MCLWMAPPEGEQYLWSPVRSCPVITGLCYPMHNITLPRLTGSSLKLPPHLKASVSSPVALPWVAHLVPPNQSTLASVLSFDILAERILHACRTWLLFCGFYLHSWEMRMLTQTGEVRMERAITKETLGTGLWPEIGGPSLSPLASSWEFYLLSQFLRGSWSTRSQTRKMLLWHLDKALAMYNGWERLKAIYGMVYH